MFAINQSGTIYLRQVLVLTDHNGSAIVHS